MLRATLLASHGSTSQLCASFCSGKGKHLRDLQFITRAYIKTLSLRYGITIATQYAFVLRVLILGNITNETDISSGAFHISPYLESSCSIL